MKKLISTILLIAFMSVAQAQTCKETYKTLGEKRDTINTLIMVGAGVTVSTIASAGAIMLMAPVVLGGAVATTATKAGVYGLYATSVGSLGMMTIDFNNKFEKVEQIITASQEGNTNNKSFQKLIKKIRKVSDKSCERINSLNDVELNAEISAFITDANQSGELCPVVKTKKGKEKPALFTFRELAKYYVKNYCQN